MVSHVIVPNIANYIYVYIYIYISISVIMTNLLTTLCREHTDQTKKRCNNIVNNKTHSFIHHIMSIAGINKKATMMNEWMNETHHIYDETFHFGFCLSPGLYWKMKVPLQAVFCLTTTTSLSQSQSIHVWQWPPMVNSIALSTIDVGIINSILFSWKHFYVYMLYAHILTIFLLSKHSIETINLLSMSIDWSLLWVGDWSNLAELILAKFCWATQYYPIMRKLTKDNKNGLIAYSKKKSAQY